MSSVKQHYHRSKSNVNTFISCQRRFEEQPNINEIVSISITHRLYSKTVKKIQLFSYLILFGFSLLEMERERFVYPEITMTGKTG